MNAVFVTRGLPHVAVLRHTCLYIRVKGLMGVIYVKRDLLNIAI